MGNIGCGNLKLQFVNTNSKNDFFNEVVLAGLILVLCLNKEGGAEKCQYALKMNALIMSQIY